MANDYCTFIQVKEELPNSGISSDHDALLKNLITRASRAIDRYTKREPGAYAVSASATDEETRYFDGSGQAYQWVDEMASAPSAVAVSMTGGRASSDYTAYASTDYFLWPYNASQIGEPYLRIDLDILNGIRAAFYRFPQSVRITAPWGYALTTTTPDEIVQATIMQVLRWHGRARQGFQDTGAIVELGQMTYTKQVEPEVGEVIAHFKRAVV